MANELVNLPGVALEPSKFGNDQAFEGLASGSYFPYILLYGSNSNLVKKGEFPMGRFGLVRTKDKPIDLGHMFNALVLGWRPKAMTFTGKVKSFYNPKSAGFKEVETAFRTIKKGYAVGPEYLLYVPAAKGFATMMFGNVTSLRVAPEVKALLGRAATFESHLIDDGNNTWHGTRVMECKTPLDMPVANSDEYTTWLDEYNLIKNRFNNPPEVEEPEEAPLETATGEERPR